MIAFAVLRQQRWAIQRRVSYRLLRQQPNSIRNPVPKKIGFFVLSANVTRMGQRYTNCQTGGTEDERIGENDSSKIQNWFLKKNKNHIEVHFELSAAATTKREVYFNMEVWQSPVYCSSLENCRLERVREFESHRFHHIWRIG